VTLRAKLAIGFAVMAAVVTVIVGSASFFSTGNVLRRQVDASLDQAARRLEAGVGALPSSGAFPADRRGRDRDRGFEQILVQVLDVDGRVVTSPRGGELPVSDRDRRIAAGTGVRSSARRTVRIDGDEYRMLTVQVVDPADRSPNGAVQFARSLGETDTILRSIRNRTLLMVMLMSTIAALIGVVIARQVTKRLVHLTDAATAVAQSGQLDTPVPVDGDDETGRLGRAFQSMLNSLARSKAQQQLVQDAGHELRTPLTSLRTNVAVMQRYDELSPASRQRLLADLESETRELSSLVDELVALATDQAADEPTSTVVLGEVAEQAAERAQRRWGRDIVVTRDGSAAVVRPQALDRAITNLVNNAIKFSDGPVEVSVAAGRVEVRDRGPGIAAADIDHLFDRFYRSEAARALPGSGLGLAIVRDMAESHGGSVFAANREGGGAVIGFVLPVVAGLPLPPPTGTGSTTPPG
jgi:two-component system sensor histidine kinase MprB